jgi:hypothetical protein
MPIFVADVDLLIDDKTSNLLPRVLVLHSRFRGIDSEPALGNDLREARADLPNIRLACNWHCDTYRKHWLVCRKRQVIGVACICATLAFRNSDELHIENVTNEVGYDGGTRAALRKGIVVANNLRQYGGNRRRKCEVTILDEKAANPTEINRAEEVFEVYVEYITALSVSSRIRND